MKRDKLSPLAPPNRKSKIPNPKWPPLLAAAALCLAALAAQAAVTVSNVSAVQTAGTKQVVVAYDVAADTATVAVSLEVRDGETVLPATSLSGDIGAEVAIGAGKQIVWNGGADWGGNVATLAFTVTADDGVAPPPVEGDYMVVDLSGGPSAPSYPVTYLSAVPPGGWTDDYKTTKLVMRRIPAGTFTMGSPEDELGRVAESEAQRQVTLTKDFYLGVFQVTQKQWERVMGTAPSYDAGDNRPVEQVSYNDIRGSSAGAGWPANSNVDASSFMGKLRDRTGLPLDLPTESQWEYACRAGTTRAYNDQTQNGGAGSDCLTTGSGSDANLEPLAWYWANSSSARHREVGTKQANAWGLYDMHGNVWEWCLDWYEAYHAPTTDPVGAASGSIRVVRGGGWIINARSCRSARRGNFNPGTRSNYVGFRLARTLP